ncbi:MAG: AMP-binding protein [Proteobacteria bacterium]|nr:AMP-binding protein [Pseudomonadota bacterium]
MTMYTRLVSQLLFPVHERLKHHDSVARRRELERSQWLDPEQLQRLQARKLRSFLADLGRHVPYYRDLFKAQGFDPEALQSVADLQQLPFLTKAIIRAHGAELRHENAGPLVRHNTGGSSGEPLIFYVGLDRVSHDVAAKWRATRWWDVDIGDPEIVVWGSPIELGAQDRVRQWRDRLLRTELLPAFEMSDANLDRFVATIAERKPRMLFGYPSALSHIARHAEAKGVPMDKLGIAVAFVTSERLYDEQRATIERVFGCRVANGYGGRDAGFIAHQCPAGGMHVTAEDIVVEIVGADDRPVPPGQAGEIVTTHMATRGFPFVRYRTGDVAVMDTRRCECGRGLPLIREIHGRTTDFVVAADGTVMHGLALVYIVRDLPGVSSFKIIQESLQRTVVQLVVDGSFPAAANEEIVTGFKKRLGPSVDVEVQLVDNIPAERSGKFRYVVSRVQQGAPAAA